MLPSQFRAGLDIGDQMKDASRPEPLSIGESVRWPSLFDGQLGASVGYAAAHFGKSLFWQAGELLLAFFLTEAAGLTPRAMGVVLALSLLASAISDLVVGRCLRRQLSRIDTTCDLQLLGAWVAAVLLIALFSTAHLPEQARLPFALVMAVMFRVAYSVYDLPQNVLLSLATHSPGSRARASSVRIALSGIAGLVLALAIAPLVSPDLQLDQAGRFLLLALILAVVAVCSASALRWVMRARSEDATFVATVPATGVPAPLPGVWLLLGMFFVLLVSAPLFGKLELYFAIHVLRSPEWAGVIMVASALGTILSQPLWCGLVTRHSFLRVVTAFGMAMLVAAGGWMLCSRSPPMAMVLAGLLGTVGGGLGMTLWAGFADAASRWAPQRIGLAYGLLTATSKVALAAGALAMGLLLGSFDYRGSGSFYIPGLMALSPAIGAGGCMLLVWIWRLRSGPLHRDRDG